MDWLSYVLTTALAPYRPLENQEKSPSYSFSAELRYLVEPSLERLMDIPWTENTDAGINSCVDSKARWFNSKWFFKNLKVSNIEPETMTVICSALKSYFMHQHTTLCTETNDGNGNHRRTTELHNRAWQHECLEMSTPSNREIAECPTLHGDPIQSKENRVLGLWQNCKIHSDLFCGKNFVKGFHIYNGFLRRLIVPDLDFLCQIC